MAALVEGSENDLDAIDDASRTTELLSEGSALHHAGTCIPCKFMKTKIGCNIGRVCNFCHFPHEEVTRNSMRKALHRTKIAWEKADRHVAWNIEALLWDAGPLSEGSALHQVGTCKPCKFMKAQKCHDGLACKYCHFPHEEVTRKTLQKERRRAARQAKELEEAIVSNSDALPSDTMAWLEPPPETRSCSEDASLVHIEGYVGSNTDQPIQLATLTEASLVDSRQDHAPKDLHNDSPCSFVANAMELSTQRFADKREEFERAIAGTSDASLSDTLAWLEPAPQTRSCKEQIGVVHIDGTLAWLEPAPQTRSCAEQIGVVHIDGDGVSTAAPAYHLVRGSQRAATTTHQTIPISLMTSLGLNG